MNVKDSWIEVYSDITDQGKRNDIEDYPHRVKCRRFNQESYDGGIVSCERGFGLLSSNMNQTTYNHASHDEIEGSRLYVPMSCCVRR